MQFEITEADIKLELKLRPPVIFPSTMPALRTTLVCSVGLLEVNSTQLLGSAQSAVWLVINDDLIIPTGGFELIQSTDLPLDYVHAAGMYKLEELLTSDDLGLLSAFKQALSNYYCGGASLI